MFDPPEGPEPELAAMPYNPAPAQGPRSAISLVRDRNEQQLLAIEGVKGVGIGRDRIGDDAFVVYALDASVRARVPTEIEGYPVEITITGEIDAL
jgi:hypothetical protein